MKKSRKIDFQIIEILVLIAILLLFVFTYSYFESFIYSIWYEKVNLVASYSLPVLFFQFLYIALVSSIVSSILGMSIGIFCQTSLGIDFKPIIEKFAIIIQTIPVMVVLVFAIIFFGIGIKAAIFSLVIQSMLPVIFSTIAGLEHIDKLYIEVGKGLGMSNTQILFKIKLPLAMPVILSGLRASVIICISAATLAFSTGAGGLGLLIQSGISTYNTVFVMEGTIPICLIAIIIDKLIRKFETISYKVI